MARLTAEMAAVVGSTAGVIGTVGAAWISARRAAQRIDERNTQQHDEAFGALQAIHTDVRDIRKTVEGQAADLGWLRSRAETNSERIKRLEQWRDDQQGDNR